MKNRLDYLREPTIQFGYGQSTEDARNGLALFGPYESPGSYTLQVGFVGTSSGLEAYRGFVDSLNHPFPSEARGRPPFPGFAEVFGMKWLKEPAVIREIPASKIERAIAIRDLKERTHTLVSMYLECILEASSTEERPCHIWFVVIPKEVWLHCRPKSKGQTDAYEDLLSEEAAGQSYLFEDVASDVERRIEIGRSDSDFHDQLKARAIMANVGVPMQIILEPTLQFKDKYRGKEFLRHMRAHLAWTQATAVYYKAGFLPWRLSQLRKGVCYLGLVYKSLEGVGQPGYACSAAQLFLDSGDGTVFRGNNGQWATENGEFHLDRTSAGALVRKALSAYKARTGSSPKELFVHARAQFSKDEWLGFLDAHGEIAPKAKVVGVVIKSTGKLKIFRDLSYEANRFGVMRGLTYVVSDTDAYLWTRGFVPELATSTSLEVPNPLRIQIRREQGDLDQILRDVLSLTKLNYNACIYGDGLPVTLRFSNLIGDILTALPDMSKDVLPFKFYI